MDMPHFLHTTLWKRTELGKHLPETSNRYRTIRRRRQFDRSEWNRRTAIRHKTHGYYRHKPIRKSQFSGRPDSPLEKGEEVAFDCQYAFDKIKTNQYYHINPQQENTILYLSIKCLPLKDEDENIYGYIIMFSDETEKYKKIEETNELFNKLKTVIGDGDSLMWEYDIKEDKMHIDLELRDPAKPSKLKRMQPDLSKRLLPACTSGRSPTGIDGSFRKVDQGGNKRIYCPIQAPVQGWIHLGQSICTTI